MKKINLLPLLLSLLLSLQAQAITPKEKKALRAKEKLIKEELDIVLAPLKIRSYRFQQTQLKINTSKINLKKGYSFVALVPSGTPLQHTNTNEIITVGRPFNVKAFVPQENQKYVFLLNKKGETVYRTRSDYLVDLTPDLEIAPTPTRYVEHSPKANTNIIDSNLVLNSSVNTHLGMVTSNYFLNVAGIGSTITSGFGLQTMFQWHNIKPLLRIDYNSFTLNGTSQAIFSAWKYGAGFQYQLPWFTTPTSLQFTILSDLSYKADIGTTNKLELSSNAIRLGLSRQSKTRFFTYSYGVDMERENISFISGHDLNISSLKESIFTLRAFIGIDFDIIF